LALKGEKIVGTMAHDLGGDLELTPHGIDRDEWPFEVLGPSKVSEQIRDRGDLDGLSPHAHLAEHEAGVADKSVQAPEALALSDVCLVASQC
jgi:hypothetical protein